MKKAFFFIALIAFLASCEKDGAGYVDPPNRYLKLAEIISLPQLNYDPDNSPPDLRIDLKRRSASFWEFSTYTEVNAASLPTFTVFPSEVLATDEMWEIRIVDEDLENPDDYEIFYWVFHPVDEGTNGEFEFIADGKLIMVLNYNEK
ncbi:MAG: hypothetical protein RLP14_04610 [Owenweeksia sp.]